MKSGSLVVKHNSTWQGGLIRVVLVVLTALIVGGSYYLGQYRAGFNKLDAREVKSKLEQSIATLQGDKNSLRDRIALLVQSAQVDKKAYLQVQDDLKQLQQENLELREEVSFFRGVVAPKEGSTGIQVESFHVEKLNDGRLHHYKFVLTQVMKGKKTTSGVVSFDLVGIKNGKPIRYSMRYISTTKESRIRFKFRYFQKFDGDLQLPEGFKPQKVKVEVHPDRRKVVEFEFDWPGESKKTALTTKKQS